MEESIGFQEFEEPTDAFLVDDDTPSEVEEAAGAEMPAQGEDAVAFSEVRVVGGENMMEERPVTEGLALFDTGVKVNIKTSTKLTRAFCQ